MFISTSILIVFFTFFSCNDESLQKYFVNNQDNDNFISIDIPASMLILNDSVTSENKEALRSLKKLNILAFKINELNKGVYSVENNKVKAILKNDKFNELLRIKHEKSKVIIKYLGDDELIDEIILFASNDNKGFVLVRVLGDKMKVESMVKLIHDLGPMQKDNDAFIQIQKLFEQVN